MTREVLIQEKQKNQVYCCPAGSNVVSLNSNCMSRMKGNFYVRFLQKEAAEMPPTYWLFEIMQNVVIY